MFDIRGLLTQMFDVEDPGQKKGRFRARADVERRLGDDPYASVRAIATAAAESLGPISREVSPLAGMSSGATASPEQSRVILLLRAMITAAKADGEVDPEERARIVARVMAAGAGDDVRRFIEEELARPVDLYAITSEVRDAATAAEVYAASLAAIHVDSEAERGYLRSLALRLGLDQATVDEISRRIGPPPAH
jgi:uncharacterized membrane protein YebE (DUF533 family)